MGPKTQAGPRADLFKLAVLPILCSKKPYVNQDHLKKLGITLKHLDVKTGDIDGAKGTARLVPMPVAVIRKMVESDLKKPREISADLRPRGNEEWEQEDKDDPDARFYQAMRVHSAVETHAYVWGYTMETKWRLCGEDAYFLEGYDVEKRVCYQLQSVCEPYSQPGVLDGSRPCIVAYQLDTSPFIDDRLLQSELNALIVLATKYDLDSKYSHCDEFVITVVTGTDRQVRLAQSKVNLARKTFDVSLSSILDFESGIKKNWEDWHTLLGWFAGTMAPPARCSKPC